MRNETGRKYLIEVIFWDGIFLCWSGFADVALVSQALVITAWAAHQPRWLEIWLVLTFSTSAHMETVAWLCLQTGSSLDGETLNTCSWHLLPRQHRWEEMWQRMRGLWNLLLLQNLSRLIFKPSFYQSSFTEQSWQKELMWFQALLMFQTTSFKLYFSLSRLVDGRINHSESLNECPESQRGIRELPSDLFWSFHCRSTRLDIFL